MILSFHITAKRKHEGLILVTLAIGMKQVTYKFETIKDARRWYRREVIKAVRRFGIEMLEAFSGH